ncbi:MAG TPA: TMEM165/GDT1 family protein [bacterium]|nr:TMEM165/GDT1 family protein [bacterium]HPO52588.1 TMEM165/GDT1 family protein [bacterium]
MNWQIFWIAFSTIFLAEIGDKTQLVCFSLSTKSTSIVPVFLGAMIAFVLSTFIACMLGNYLQKVVPVNVIHSIAGVILIVSGILVLINKL